MIKISDHEKINYCFVGLKGYLDSEQTVSVMKTEIMRQKCVFHFRNLGWLLKCLLNFCNKRLLVLVHQGLPCL